MDHREKKFAYGLKCGWRRKILAFLSFFLRTPSILRAGDLSMRAPKKSNFGLQNGTPAEVSFNGTSISFFIKVIKRWLNGPLKNVMNDGTSEEFDGVSIIRWANDGTICSLKEFGCNIHRYDPYADSDTPRLRDETARWF